MSSWPSARGAPNVLKFFRDYPDNPWGELEMDILRHVKHPNVVRVLGHGRWPYPDEGYLYLVMEYVEGLPLLRHALVHNPSARRAATLMREAAGALSVVHNSGAVPWVAAGAVLRGPKGEVLKPLPLWQPEPDVEGWRRVVVEVPASEKEARGTYTLMLWDAEQKRTVTLGHVTFL